MLFSCCLLHTIKFSFPYFYRNRYDLLMSNGICSFVWYSRNNPRRSPRVFLKSGRIKLAPEQTFLEPGNPPQRGDFLVVALGRCQEPSLRSSGRWQTMPALLLRFSEGCSVALSVRICVVSFLRYCSLLCI